MTVTRREFLKRSGLGLSSLFITDVNEANLSIKQDDDSMGMLFDAARCIGCRECQIACRQRRIEEDPKLTEENVDTNPKELSAETWTLIKLYQDEQDESVYSFVKAQCMHCLDPACVTACPVGALEKTKLGPVIYHDKVCIGCRYCMAACPFDIPKYQWEEVFPLIQKCDFCADRLAQGQIPACAEACKNDVLIYGKRSDLLKIARERIAEHPDHYINHIYGEFELGGTSILFISAVAFEKLGLPTYAATALPNLTWPWMSAVPGIFAGMASLMTGIYFLRKRGEEKNKEAEEKNEQITS